VISLEELQARRKAWAIAAGLQTTVEDMTDLLVEELGEMAHARNKLRNNIRGGALSAAQLLDDERDAVGDLVISLAGYCTARNISLQECVERAWEEVRQRDWGKFPVDGVSR
jgi:NTP pyrophosphatase (non-canonical NTP hydrolase)